MTITKGPLILLRLESASSSSEIDATLIEVAQKKNIKLKGFSW